MTSTSGNKILPCSSDAPEHWPQQWRDDFRKQNLLLEETHEELLTLTEYLQCRKDDIDEAQMVGRYQTESINSLARDVAKQQRKQGKVLRDVLEAMRALKPAPAADHAYVYGSLATDATQRDAAQAEVARLRTEIAELTRQRDEAQNGYNDHAELCKEQDAELRRLRDENKRLSESLSRAQQFNRECAKR